MMPTAVAKRSEQAFDVDSTYFCSEEGCGRNVPLQERQRHDDYHLAMRLSRDPSWEKRKAPRAAVGTRIGKKARRDRSQKTILSMLVKNKT